MLRPSLHKFFSTMAKKMKYTNCKHLFMDSGSGSESDDLSFTTAEEFDDTWRMDELPLRRQNRSENGGYAVDRMSADDDSGIELPLPVRRRNRLRNVRMNVNGDIEIELPSTSIFLQPTQWQARGHEEHEEDYHKESQIESRSSSTQTTDVIEKKATLSSVFTIKAEPPPTCDMLSETDEDSRST